MASLKSHFHTNTGQLPSSCRETTTLHTQGIPPLLRGGIWETITTLFSYFLEESEAQRFSVLYTLVMRAEPGLLDSVLCSYRGTASWYSVSLAGVKC